MVETFPNGRKRASQVDLDAVTIGGARRLDGRVQLVEYDAAWPERYESEAKRIRSVVGETVLRIEHVGSTAVPGLAAKPVIDIVMEVPNSRDEAAYVAPLVACGYELRIREPHWHEHRVLKGSEPDVNLHVFTVGCPEVARMVRFREHLRTNPPDRELYEAKKRELASHNWEYIQNYADAKTNVIEQIIARAGCDAG